MASDGEAYTYYERAAEDDDESLAWCSKKRALSAALALLVLNAACGFYFVGGLGTTGSGAAPRGGVDSVELAVGKTGPAMVHYSQIVTRQLPRCTFCAPGSEARAEDMASSAVPGKEMTAGLYRLDAGPRDRFTFAYEEFMFVVSGEFVLADGTGQALTAAAGDLLYFPLGSTITFDAPSTALGYFVAQRGVPVEDVPVTAEVKAAISSNPAMVHIPQIVRRRLPYLKNKDGSSSWLEDIGFSLVPGREMTAGLYRDKAGPALHYVYDYEELKLIVEGEFHLEDGTGQKVIAKAGDLMYFPKGVPVKFVAPVTALGFFCGQRKGGTA